MFWTMWIHTQICDIDIPSPSWYLFYLVWTLQNTKSEVTEIHLWTWENYYSSVSSNVSQITDYFNIFMFLSNCAGRGRFQLIEIYKLNDSFIFEYKWRKKWTTMRQMYKCKETDSVECKNKLSIFQNLMMRFMI